MGGDIENEGAILAGQGVAMIDSIKPVDAIIDEMMARCEKVLAGTKIYGWEEKNNDMYIGPVSYKTWMRG